MSVLLAYRPLFLDRSLNKVEKLLIIIHYLYLKICRECIHMVMFYDFILCCDMLRSSSHISFDQKIQHFFKQTRWGKHLVVTKELYLLFFFSFLFFLLVLRLFFLQIVNHNYYDTSLNTQHVSETSLKAKRGNLFADDKAQKHIQLTDNVSLYNVYVDPKFIWDKEKFISLMTPVVYQHLCVLYGMDEMDMT